MRSRAPTPAASSSPKRRPEVDDLRITGRDVELLLSLFRYRDLSVSQLQRLHFPSGQTTARRLRLLAAGGLVKVSQCGSQERLVRLRRAGAEVVAERLGVSVKETGWDRRREAPRDPLFVRHFLAVNDFRITLEQACASHPDIRLLGFMNDQVMAPEGGAPRKFIRGVVAGANGRQLGHVPDAAFALQRGERAALFFVEIDRGTEVIGSEERGLLKAIRFYLDYLVAGSFDRYRREFNAPGEFDLFRVLILVPTTRRLMNVRAASNTLAFEPANARRFLWLATLDALHDRGLLRMPWCSVDALDDRSYVIES